MAFASHRHPASFALRQAPTLAVLTAALMLSACGQSLTSAKDLLSINSSAPPVHIQAAGKSEAPADPDELRKATEYWGKQYAENSRDLDIALKYARNLKAMGEKRQAMAVLQQVSIFHGNSRDLASEYGRLALDLDQVQVAKRLLAMADDPTKPDWRVISARGAALAKEGNYNDAIPYFEKALTLSNNQPSVVSNLALAHAMNGEPNKAESMLRLAAASDSQSPRIRQNLALVLGLQGKYDEAKLVAARDIPITNANDNADYLRQVVKLDPKSVPNSNPMPAEWNTEAKVAQAPVAAAVPVQKIADVQPMPPIDADAAKDTGWVVAAEQPAPAAPATVAERAPAPAPKVTKVMSVAQMAAQFAVDDDSVPAKPKEKSAAPAKPVAAAPTEWSPLVAQAKR
jgi:Flp pilus assembly protein TadD